MNKFYYPLFLIITFTMFYIIFMMIMNSFNMNSMIILLMLYSILIFITLSTWSKNYLYSIIMFLTLISGLLVIFLYFTSLISNMKNNFQMNNLLTMMFIMNTTTMMTLIKKSPIIHKDIYFNYPSYNYYQAMMNFYSHSLTKMNMMINMNENIFSNIFNLYIYPYNNITLLCMFFLLMAMFSIIKICSIKSLTLRKINK